MSQLTFGVNVLSQGIDSSEHDTGCWQIYISKHRDTITDVLKISQPSRLSARLTAEEIPHSSRFLLHFCGPGQLGDLLTSVALTPINAHLNRFKSYRKKIILRGTTSFFLIFQPLD